MKKSLPSLSSNFAKIVRENGFYVDKTMFIEKLEEYNFTYFFFLRPRRFGKSLFLSLLEHYYGVQYKDDFEGLFGEYYIGKNPTPLKNSYYILNFNFSGINTQTEKEIFNHFTTEVAGAVELFISVYGLLTEEEKKEILSVWDAGTIIRKFFFKVSAVKPGIKLFVLIDEYDHFTNELLSFNKEHFKSIVSQNGWVRKFYEIIKQFSGSGLVDRFFATGVTPVTLDSMTSGFNIAKNITLRREFHDIAGFSETELRTLIEGTIHEQGKFDLDQLINDIRSWYNGSRFSPEHDGKLYNPQMVINFLEYFGTQGEYPVSMYDPSVSSDYTKIKNQLNLISREKSDEIITQIIEKEAITEGLTLQYNFEDEFSRTDLVSLLFYNGLLTIGSADGSIINYAVPNYVVKLMYWDFLRKYFSEDRISEFSFNDLIAILDEMRYEGKVDNLLSYTSGLINKISNRDLVGFRESHLKLIMLAVLSFSNIYKIDSEIEINRKYIDLYLSLQPNYNGKFSFLLELKYLKSDEIHKYQDTITEGINQVKSYLKLKDLKKDDSLKAFLIVFRNDKGEAFEVE